jgi:hypothetical protein
MRTLMVPMRDWSQRAKAIAFLGGVLLGASFAVSIAVHQQPFFHIADSSQYLRLANGNVQGAMQPFASRPLAPMLAHSLAASLHLSIHGGFYLEAALSLLVLLVIVCWLMLGSSAPRWMLVAVVVVPTWVTLVQNLVFPDLFYASLLAGMLLLLQREHLLAAALMMFPLMLTRESTSLTLLCFLLAAWSSLRWRDRIAAVIAAAAGTAVVGRLAAAAQPNVEHLPEAVYMLAKIPWNFMRNVLGVLPWSDANTDLCKVPVWSFPFHLGPVHALGVCGVSFQQQLVAIDVTLGNFGLLPMLLVWLWWRGRRGPKRSLLLRFTLLYGAVSFLLAPIIGAGFLHLVGYAWPLFLVATPLLFAAFKTASGADRRVWASAGFFVVHLAVCGAAFWAAFLPGIGVKLALWVVGFLLLWLWSPEAENGPVLPPSRRPEPEQIHSSSMVKSA